MRVFFSFLTLSFFLFNCKNNPQPLQQAKAESDLPKDFKAFYQQFHSDSAYQMAHIEWPLKGETGVNKDTSNTVRLTEWLPENWRVMQFPDTTMSTLKRSFETVGDVMVIERMAYPMVGMGYERQFYKEENGEWRLIYYAESTAMRLE